MSKVSSQVKIAVIPAAGLGTRFLPLTKSQPKEMLPLVDKPAIQYVVEEAVNAGIDDILIITGRGKRAIEDHFDRNFELDYALREKGKVEELEILEQIESLANIHYIRQRDPNGLGHAVSVAKAHVGEHPFAVMLGDDIMADDSNLLKDMKKDFETHSSSVIGLMKVDPNEISSYGCVGLDSQIDEDLVKIKEIVEKPAKENAPSNLAVIGRYIFSPEIFDCIDQINPGYGGEIQLTDAISMLLQKQNVYGRILKSGRYDVGQKADWILANISLALEREDLRDEVKRGLKEILDRQ
ncbi:MAG: UTP--glucose-1-phosphate uridylyltransferase GalU [Acidimicrobiia bacterium]